MSILDTVACNHTNTRTNGTCALYIGAHTIRIYVS
jgi:hypothetical protein